MICLPSAPQLAFLHPQLNLTSDNTTIYHPQRWGKAKLAQNTHLVSAAENQITIIDSREDHDFARGGDELGPAKEGHRQYLFVKEGSIK
jgi:hypothetical protein